MPPLICGYPSCQLLPSHGVFDEPFSSHGACRVARLESQRVPQLYPFCLHPHMDEISVIAIGVHWNEYIVEIVHASRHPVAPLPHSRKVIPVCRVRAAEKCINQALNTCTLAALRPPHGCIKTFPTKFTMLSCIHFMGGRVTMSWRTTLSSPPPGLALTSTGSLPSPRCHLLFSSFVMVLPVFLGVTHGRSGRTEACVSHGLRFT